MSTNAAGTDSAAGAAQGLRFSADGSRLTFVSDAPDVVAAAPRPGCGRCTCTTWPRAPPFSPRRTQPGPGRRPRVLRARLSADGNRVAFVSRATDLAAGDSNGAEIDVVVRDLAAGTTQVVSRDVSGASTGDGMSHNASFALGGSAVVFESEADDLVAVDTNGTVDVFRHDLASGVTTLVSASAAGGDSAAGHSSTSAVSQDGDTVAFVSTAADLGPVDGDDTPDIYVQELGTGAVTLASSTPDVLFPTDPVLSPDGSQVAWVAAGAGVFVSDLVTGETELVSVDAAGTGGGNACRTDRC